MTIAAEQYEEQAKEAIASSATLALNCKLSEKNALHAAKTTGKTGRPTKASAFVAGKHCKSQCVERLRAMPTARACTTNAGVRRPL
ncbi:MAG TPA: hypothetical protein VKH44_12395 [Pirellulaceae bacterium]|nr:hypothetical protein [Pirellulaceae bacterium]